jgi:hypothetical protein
VLCEKRIDIARYKGGELDDDAGWSDGWDYDTLRLASCPPTPDSRETRASARQITAGAAHAAGFYGAWADGSVRPIAYEVDLETFNRWAHKSDGEPTAELE